MFLRLAQLHTLHASNASSVISNYSTSQSWKVVGLIRMNPTHGWVHINTMLSQVTLVRKTLAWVAPTSTAKGALKSWIDGWCPLCRLKNIDKARLALELTLLILVHNPYVSEQVSISCKSLCASGEITWIWSLCVMVHYEHVPLRCLVHEAVITSIIGFCVVVYCCEETSGVEVTSGSCDNHKISTPQWVSRIHFTRILLDGIHLQLGPNTLVSLRFDRRKPRG